MSMFEDKIKSNLSHFDSEEPPDGHFERFEAKLKFQERTPGSPSRIRIIRIISIAALFLILLSTGLIIYLFPPTQLMNQAGTQVAKISLPIEVQMMMNYYNQITESQIDTLKSITPENGNVDEISKIARQEINSLDTIIDSLKVEYSKNKNNDQIYSALVFTQQKKTEILETIIAKVNDGNDWQKSHSQSKF